MLKQNSATIAEIQELALTQDISGAFKHSSVDTRKVIRDRQWSVVDSNYLRNAKLFDLLSDRNRGVAITHDVVTEMVKRDSVRTAFESLKNLRGSYEQIAVLKDNSTITSYPYPITEIIFLVDFHQTNIFRWLIHSHVEDCATCRANLIEVGKSRAHSLLEIENDASGWLKSFNSVATDFSKDDLKELVGNNPISRQLARKIAQVTWSHCISFYNEQDAFKLFSANECTRTCFYRIALAHVLQAIGWAATGRNFSVKKEKVLNDIIDARIVGVASFFKEVLSSDIKLNRLYDRVKSVIELIEREGLPKHCDECDLDVPPRYQQMYNRLSLVSPMSSRRSKLSAVAIARDRDLAKDAASKTILRNISKANLERSLHQLSPPLRPFDPGDH